jgi:hypothetical protein
MQLTIEGHSRVFVEGTVTLELPVYMRLLPADELEEARTAENRDGLILAAGFHPNGEDIVFVTGVGDLMELNIWQHGLPPVAVEPIDFGQTLRFSVKTGSYEVSNTWALEHASSILFLGAMAKPEGARVYLPR